MLGKGGHLGAHDAQGLSALLGLHGALYLKQGHLIVISTAGLTDGTY